MLTGLTTAAAGGRRGSGPRRRSPRRGRSWSATAAEFDRPNTQHSASDAGINQVVTTWTSANVRSCASTNCGIVYSVGANTGLNASCWAHGQWVNQNGVAHDKWVRLYSGNWIWGGLLKGNETGGVSTRC